MYGPGGRVYSYLDHYLHTESSLASYHVFAGKDASKGLGLSSVKVEDAVPDYSTLDEASMKTLDGWYEFYQ